MMKKMIDWHLVGNNSFKDFEEEMDRFIKDGWQLQGGICVVQEENREGWDTCFYQMLVIYEN